jgi:D-alanyl-D-alanine carboxypeptidase
VAKLKNIKKIICLIAAICLVFPASAFQLSAKSLNAWDIYAETAVVYDAGTGKVLFGKDINKKMIPASITKILTGMLTIERVKTTDIVTVNRSALIYGTNMSLKAGERLSVDSLMYGLMLPSANDAANALAEYISGSQKAFVKLMNQRAAEIGAKNSYFSNASGVTSRNGEHYTTAYDMALITREAIRYDKFMKYFSAPYATIPATNLSSKRSYTNLGYMLVPGLWQYDSSVTGEKIGWTRQAAHTMSTVAKRDGHTLICVVMKTTKDGKFTDTQKLLDYGFSLLD